MTHPLERSAARLCKVAVATFVIASMFSVSVDAQTASNKRAASGKSRKPVAAAIHAKPWVPNPAVTSKDAYLVVDAATGRELASDHPDELRHPASLTKLMTLYLAFSALDAGHLSLADRLTASANALNAPPTKMGLAGGNVTVRDAVMGLITRSANDAAVALAEMMGGSEAGFARQMTQRARQLGMTSTVFRNASGLPNREQVTTARDMSRLAYALLRDFPHYYPVFSVVSFSYHGRSLENHNRMLASYAGADGLKTGYTNASGFNLVMSAVRDNRRLIGVVMGGSTALGRDRLMADLMDRAFVDAQTMGLSSWASTRAPSSARFTAAHFVPGLGAVEAFRGFQPAKVEAAQLPSAAAATSLRAASNGSAPRAATAASAAAGTPATGSWVIQVGSFAESRAARAALERASAALPGPIRAQGVPTVDQVRMARKTLHRARVGNLTREQAAEGCKRLGQRKIYCAAIEVTTWNKPGAR